MRVKGSCRTVWTGKKTGRRIAEWVLSGLLCAGLVTAGERPDQLPIGDAERRERQAAVALDTITDTRDGAVLDPAELTRRLAGTRLLLIGESHTSEEFHRVQEMVLGHLHDAGRRVLIGLEMMPTDAQQTLDSWVAGELSEERYVDEGGWYQHWGYAWEYYRPIFRLARRTGMPMLGLNVPRDLVSAVREGGFESLGEDDRGRLPPKIQPVDEAFQRHFLSYFDDDSGMHAMDGGMLEGFLRSQSAWDASMAWSAVQVLAQEAHRDPKTILVVLVGSGHVAYGHGIARQAAPWTDSKIETLIPVPVADDGEPIGSVVASYADYVWGVAEESWPRFPSLGISTRRAGDEDKPGRAVLFVDDESPAASLDIQSGDHLIAVDGHKLTDVAVLRRAMGEKRWGDTVHLKWTRDGDEGAVTMEGTVYLRRSVE